MAVIDNRRPGLCSIGEKKKRRVLGGRSGGKGSGKAKGGGGGRKLVGSYVGGGGGGELGRVEDWAAVATARGSTARRGSMYVCQKYVGGGVEEQDAVSARALLKQCLARLEGLGGRRHKRKSRVRGSSR